jgi:dihydroorotate dehydrogenase (NAD+) catalytic subunit
MAPVKIGKLKLNNPLMPASGTMAYNYAYSPYLDYSKLGAIVTKAVTFTPRSGNPPPRLVETEHGIINSVGLQNPGLDYFIKNELPKLASYGPPIIVNVAGSDLEEYCQVAERLATCYEVSAIEINISCPNVKEGYLAFGARPYLTKEVIAAVRAVFPGTIIVKLSPNVADIVPIARAAEAAGADALSLINTVKAEAKGVSGGVSGPAIRATALKLLRQTRTSVEIPLIGLGGISSAKDVQDFMAAGACAIQIGTAALIRPWIFEEILAKINRDA